MISNKISSLIVFFGVLSYVLASSTTTDLLTLAAGDDQLCNPTGVAFRYTGMRLYQTTFFDWPVRHYWFIARCNSGKVASQQYFVANRTENFNFGDKFCISEKECYILARRKKYATRKVPVFRPYAEVGAIYKVDQETNQTVPLNMLTADNMASVVTLKTSFGTRMKYLPILFTPEGEPRPQWYQQHTTNPFENYVYSEGDRQTTWFITNFIVNELSDTLSINGDNMFFWEFDALQKQLNGLNWREAANKAIPTIG